MRQILALATVAFIAVVSVTSDAQARSEGIVAKPSAFSVKETIDRLEAVLKSKGIKVMARVDHAAAAKAINKQMRPAEILIFGTPKIGTPLMQSNIIIGIDLPLKAMAYEDEQGQVYLVYNHPGYLVRRHGITDHNKLVSAISRVLTNLTDQAIKQK